MTTCLTLAAMHKVKGLVTLLAIKELMFKVNDANPDSQTTNIGYGSTKGFKSLFHRFAMAVISPDNNEIIKHWIIANGAMCPNRSTGCNFSDPVNISPEATTFNAAKKTQNKVTNKPRVV
jgi:hypothetical protein